MEIGREQPEVHYGQLFSSSLRESCLICGEREFEWLFPSRIRQAGGTICPNAKTKYEITKSSRELIGLIVTCKSCGLCFLPQSIVEVDEDTYSESEDPNYAFQAAQRMKNAERLLNCLPQEKSTGKLLDVGCACGFLLRAARKRGFQVCGIEPSGWAAEYAERELDISVYHGRIQDQPFEREYFDVVVLADVIEHLKNPAEVLGYISSILVPGGVVLILTPDIGSVTAKLLRRFWWGLLDDHYFYFSRETIRRLLRPIGFEVVYCRSFGRTFELSHWILKISQYSVSLYRFARVISGAFKIGTFRMYLNLGDQMVCLAIKKG